MAPLGWSVVLLIQTFSEGEFSIALGPVNGGCCIGIQVLHNPDQTFY